MPGNLLMALSLDPLLMPRKASSWGGLNQMEELSRGEHEARDVGSKAETAESSLQGTAGVHWRGGRGTKNLGRPK